MNTILEQSETFVRVKESLESEQLKKLRLSHVFKAFKLQMKENRHVQIFYNCDQADNQMLITSILRFDHYYIATSENKQIPIRAIKTIRFS